MELKDQEFYAMPAIVCRKNPFNGIESSPSEFEQR
jgi:hypothetical protein